MPSKHIRSLFPTTTGGGGGTPTVDTPSARFSEDATAEDILKVATVHSEDATVDDSLTSVLVTNPEAATADDLFAVPLVFPAFSEDATANDVAKVVLLSVDVARSGTPDSDLMFDAYIDQLAAVAGNNFGNADLKVKGKATVTNDEQRGLLALKLTDFTSWTANNTGLTFSVKAATSSILVATTVTWTATRSAAQPFTESTVTWNAPPPAGTAVTSGTFSVATGAAQAFTFTITAAQLGACLGQWLLVTFTCASAALPDTVTVTSRDNATASNRPTFAIDNIQRGT